MTEFHLLISHGGRCLGKEFFKMLLFVAVKEMMLKHQVNSNINYLNSIFSSLQNLTWLTCRRAKSWLILTVSWRRPLSCSANQWTCFYMIEASIMMELIIIFTCFMPPVPPCTPWKHTRSSVFIVNFEPISNLFLVFLLLALNN